MSKGPLLLPLIVLIACNGDDIPDSVEAPFIETDYAFFATAPEGRSIQPFSVQILRTAEVSTLKPQAIGGGDVDMLYAGIKSADLPLGVAPESLEWVASTDERARPLPTLHSPHVMDVPSPAEMPTKLVPVEGDRIPREYLEDRRIRFEKMVEKVAMKETCVEPLTPIFITTPNTPARSILALRTLSTGDTYFGLSTTSTAVIGRLPAGGTNVELIGVSTGTVAVVPGDGATVVDLGDTEATDRDGLVLPGELSVTISGGFGGASTMVRFDENENRYVDDTPLVAGLPRGVSGARHLNVDGAPSICVYGSLQGSERNAAIWCRVETSTTWAETGFFRTSVDITGVTQKDDNAPIYAFDVYGSIFERSGGGWQKISASALNDGCPTPCISFGKAAVNDQPNELISAVLLASDAQLLLVKPAGGKLTADSGTVVTDTLFSYERMGAVDPLIFTAVDFAPDGAIWIGTKDSLLFRISPDLGSVQRICMPKDAEDTGIMSIEAHPDGRLILGLSPAFMGVGRWQM